MFQSESEHLAPRTRFVAEAADSCDVTIGKIRFSTFAVGVRNRFSFENLMWDNGVADEGAASSSSLWCAKVKHSGFLVGVDILGCCFTCSWSTFAACTLFKRTHDGLIHRARNFLHVISSCVDSNELELLSRPCHRSFGIQNHFVPCGRLVVRAKDALHQQPH